MKPAPKRVKILKAKHAGKYSLSLTFSDGKEQMVDLELFLKASQHPEIRKYLKPALFKRFRLDGGELMWGDYDLIFPVMDLYNNSIVLTPSKAAAKRAD